MARPAARSAVATRFATALLSSLVALSFACSSSARAPSTTSASQATPRVAADALPSLERWRAHLVDELLPFWLTPDALGQPVGNFPTFRCNDGSAYRSEAPCPELAKPPGWISPELSRDYTRMKSRQTFLYGVAFHVTGDERFLTYAKAGVDWLRANAYDRQTGSAVSYWTLAPSVSGRVALDSGSPRVPGPPLEQRTSQDLAYAQLGLAFYYYLTRDPDVLTDLVRLERFVMQRYWQPSPASPGGQLRWTLADGATYGESNREELVSQLDQINAYMLLLAPLLEDKDLAAAWRKDLLLLARVIQERYFAPEHGMFWGRLDDPKEKRLGGRHTDFGHSMKAFWMLYLTGQATGEPSLTDFARPHVAPLLARAAQPSGCWASSVSPTGQLDRGSQWWVFAELDQAAATLAVREPDATPFVAHLAPAYACWLTRFVDRRHGDVWPFVPPDWTEQTFATGAPLKAFHWKSGYHQAEHALIALITTASLTAQRLPLYYAFAKPPAAERIQPYYFRGTIANDKSHPLPSHPGLAGRRIEFTDLR